jgi:hypothetical protein
LRKSSVIDHQVVPSSQTVHEAVETIWRSIGERVDEDFTPETTKPLAPLVLSGEIDPLRQRSELFSPESGLVQPATTSFSAFSPKNPTYTYFIPFGMPSSWSYAVEVSKGNKENGVTGLANLSITDDVGSKKLAGEQT